MEKQTELRQLLISIDRKGYPAYKQTRGRWDFGTYVLSIDHVQGDPFASPSKVSVTVKGEKAGFPAPFYQEENRRIALQDLVLRAFAGELSSGKRHYAGSGKSGLVTTSVPGQEILERSAVSIHSRTGDVVLRFEVGFPANGRTINSRELIRILFDELPPWLEKCLFYRNLGQEKVKRSMDLADDQAFIRRELSKRHLTAFVADGSVLPRESGISDRPMKHAVPFVSPPSLEEVLELPHRGRVRGMAVPRGITLIVGGGYHGKSTLLGALERGVYNHIAGDGRELVITDRSAMKIRAEDGRSIWKTDISLFIHDLPNKKETTVFETPDASGSTSQAANVIEAMEAGTSLLLIDEDTSATNFMVRDELMQMVISRDKEPITPFITRIRFLYEKAGISTILVAGSSGAFFGKADCVIQMDNYLPRDITGQAKAAWTAYRKTAGADQKELAEKEEDSGLSQGLPLFENRKPSPDTGLLRGEGRIRVKIPSKDNFLIERDEVILRGVEQIVDKEQTASLAYILKYLQLHIFDGKTSVRQAVDWIEDLIRAKGLEVLFDGACIANGLAAPRREEVFAMIDRWRRL
ncbi:MAG: ABC-ATPase domain-containing protein [Blautia sp.]|nr:ABC-ATPase domain-containing protein [Blautia sp.]